MTNPVQENGKFSGETVYLRYPYKKWALVHLLCRQKKGRKTEKCQRGLETANICKNLSEEYMSILLLFRYSK